MEEYISGFDATCGVIGNIGPDGNTENIHVFPISSVDYNKMKETVPQMVKGTLRNIYFFALSVSDNPEDNFYHRGFKALSLKEYRHQCPAPFPEPITKEVYLSSTISAEIATG